MNIKQITQAADSEYVAHELDVDNCTVNVQVSSYATQGDPWVAVNAVVEKAGVNYAGQISLNPVEARVTALLLLQAADRAEGKDVTRGTTYHLIGHPGLPDEFRVWRSSLPEHDGTAFCPWKALDVTDDCGEPTGD